MKDAVKYYLKRCIFYLSKISYLFPLKKNTVLFTSFLGKQYSCNPKYISEYLEKELNNVKLVWAFNNPEEFKFLEKRGITIIRFKSFLYIYYRLFAQVIVTNVGEFAYIPVRKKQLFINTWHGGGCYKRVGMNNAKKKHSKYYVLEMQQSYNNVNLFLSSSEAFTEQTIRQSMNYHGEILENGMPRNDLLFLKTRADITKKVRQYYRLKDEKICLFAPTYRDTMSAEDFGLDFALLKSNLIKRFGGEWVILYRSHQFLNKAEIKHECTSASDYPDMQELLYNADVLITDYSSSIWDFSLTKKPCFLFTSDLEEYLEERNFYTPIETWGFPLARNNQEMTDMILNFDSELFEKNMDMHQKNLGSFESGNATERVCDFIKEKCLNGERK